GTRRPLAEISLDRHAGAPEEQGLRSAAEGEWPELLGHPVLHDHEARHLRRPLEVVVGAGGYLAVDDLLGGAAAQEHRDAVLQLAPGEEIAVFQRELIGRAQRADSS